MEFDRTKIIEKMRNEGEICRQELRSFINPCYANRFIREFLLDGTNENK